jgi:two-component system, NarL family, nitrate/nitrite response regulator NarL
MIVGAHASARPTPDVVIVDDHGLLAQSLVFALRADGLTVERCSELSAEGIVGMVESLEPEVVLLDLDLGGNLGSSTSMIPALTATGTKVVMVTGVTDRVRLAECIQAGATGVIAKSEPFERLVEGVRHVVDDGDLLSPQQREDYLSELRRHRSAQRQRFKLFDQLTPREMQVLAALIDGQSAEQIAAEAFVSITTVRSQIRSVLSKLGVNSQLAAVALARRSGWSSPAGDGWPASVLRGSRPTFPQS